MSSAKKVLFISYHFEPYTGVGAQRVSYWAKHIKEVSQGQITCDVITSTPQADNLPAGIDQIYHVANKSASSLSLFIKDEGLTWKEDIRRFIEAENGPLEYDAVVMSGGPFVQFELTSFLKARFSCAIILDFRDPFANNPRFNDGFLKAMAKSYYEKKFLAGADQVITVNKYCADIIKSSNSYVPVAIIDNGFDDYVITSVSQNAKERSEVISFIYTGSFYEDRNPDNFLSTINEKKNVDQFSMTHVGNKSEFLAGQSSAGLKELGSKSYSDTLQEIQNADVGIIFTGGTAFESTTKIFDYIGLNKPIAIITAGKTRKGALHDITAAYPCVFWAENNETSIQNMLEEIKSSNLEVDYPDRDTFSRRAGLIQLINLLT